MSNSPFLTDLFRSFFLKRPPSRSLVPSWSPPVVPRALAEAPFEPLQKASLFFLTVKTVFLIAIASGQRCSSIHALSVDPGHLRWENSGVRLIPSASFLAKNQTESSGLIEIFSSFNLLSLGDFGRQSMVPSSGTQVVFGSYARSARLKQFICYHYCSPSRCI